MSLQLVDLGYASMRQQNLPAVGARPLLVVLVEWSDHPPFAATHPREYYERLAFGNPLPPFSTDGPVNPASLSGYLWQCSLGRFTVKPAHDQTAGVIGPIVMGRPFPNPDQGLEPRSQEVLTRVGRDFPQIFLRADADGNQSVVSSELTVLMIENYRQYAPHNRPNLPVKVQLPTAPGLPAVFETVTVLIAGVGPLTPFYQVAHEVSHGLGTRDMYDGAGANSLLTLMAGYSFFDNDQGTVHLDGWHKLALGWCEPRVQELRASGPDVVVTETSPTRPDGAVILWHPNQGSGEFFLVERRTPSGVNRAYDSGVAGDGVLVWRVKPGAAPPATHLGAPAATIGGTGVWSSGQSVVLPWSDGSSTQIRLTFEAVGQDFRVRFTSTGGPAPAPALPVRETLVYYGAKQGRGAVGRVGADHGLRELRAIPPGSLATDWTAISGLTNNRVLFYGATKGRGVICRVGADASVTDMRVYPHGSFADDWTAITALTADRLLYYGAAKGRGAIGRVGADGDAAQAHNGLGDLRSFGPGTFATDWTAIVGLSGDRILYYSAKDGRGVIGQVTPDNSLGDLRAFPAGTFATGWTAIVGLSGDRILYYSAKDGRGVIGRVTPDNSLGDLRAFPAGTFATDWTEIASF